MSEIASAIAKNYKTTLVGMLCLAGALAAWLTNNKEAAASLIGAGITAILSKDGDK
ncbi:hypothetical protein [Candidatus Magnetominusculus xianensis]|uniref:Secreted protein n=1 Tax=Candidatus Magnetominusculus xianensis TaxID=1748249 RepID=A0ABR5SBF4_9BACT|nr:hypothetical protein [Candidatus Magnetominusculus xianensis]KWT77354.1 hypothetical protein ASN18_3049 [Candidatus Magnetominusculus xianensis]MBF0404963.1 hypothetical protein [Nitrospirota bacterium]